LRPWSQTIDGSGLDPATGSLHTHLDVNSTMGLSGFLGSPITRGGTVYGSHWVEYRLDQVYALDEMWIWNYNEQNYPAMGMKEVTIQVSDTGGYTSADWTTVFDGQIPIASGGGAAEGPHDLTLPLGGVQAKWIVITADYLSGRNHSGGDYEEAGLSEVRFFGSVPAPAEPVAAGIALSGGGPDSIVISWSSTEGASYAVDRAADPVVDGFTEMTNGVPADPPQNTLAVDAGPDHAAFRVRPETP
jgi:hypothetical protein